MKRFPIWLRRASATTAPAPLRRFPDDARGVAAVEFAIILPLMLTLYMGVLELSMGYQASRKVSLFSRTAADLTSQSSGTLSSSEMDDIRKSANWILAPFPIATGQVRMTVSAVSFLGTAAAPTAQVNWSVGYEGVKRACGALTVVASEAPPSLTTIPMGVAAPDTSLIVADVAYDYQPLLGGSFQSFGGGNLTQISLKQTSYMKPRNVAYVDLQAGIAAANYCTAWHP